MPESLPITLIPTLRYRDATAAIAWLEAAFGFSVHRQIDDGEGGIAHAQLKMGNYPGFGMIMIGSARDDDYGQLVQPPIAPAMLNTQAPYVIIGDVDAMYEQAKAAGAEVVVELADQDYGGRGFGCRDLEGNVWNFGSYNPWEYY